MQVSGLDMENALWIFAEKTDVEDEFHQLSDFRISEWDMPDRKP